MSKFCKLPWLAVSVREEGNLQPCCLMRNFDRVDDWQSYYDSPQLKRIQQDFLAGKQPTECNDCWIMEDSGNKSLRQMTAGHAKKFDIDYNAVNDPVYLELSITQICNLACRICAPSASTRWIVDHNKLAEFDIELKPYTAKPKRHLTDPIYVDWILSRQSNLKFLQFLGGEPLADQLQEQADLLSKLDNPADIQLSYTTNGTFLPPAELVKEWPKFKQVIINNSLDGIGAAFEYNRYPAKWEKVEANVLQWVEFAASTDNVMFKVNYTVSALNIYNLPEFDVWANEHNFDITYSLLIEPLHYNIKNLSPAVKEFLRRRLCDHPLIIAGLDPAPSLPYDYNIFVNKTNALDKVRNQSFLEIYPKDYTDLFNF